MILWSCQNLEIHPIWIRLKMCDIILKGGLGPIKVSR